MLDKFCGFASHASAASTSCPQLDASASAKSGGEKAQAELAKSCTEEACSGLAPPLRDLVDHPAASPTSAASQGDATGEHDHAMFDILCGMNSETITSRAPSAGIAASFS